MIFELNRKVLRDNYNLNFVKMIGDGYAVVWSEDRIKKAFNTRADFYRYQQVNDKICIYFNITLG